MICTKIGKGDQYEKSVEDFVVKRCPGEKRFLLERLDSGEWKITVAPVLPAAIGEAEKPSVEEPPKVTKLKKKEAVDGRRKEKAKQVRKR